jgi:hypothetical protein
MRIANLICPLAGVLLFGAGCQTMAPFGKDPTSSPLAGRENKYPAPAKVAVIWSPAVLNQPGQPPTRGFGGRVYFYDASNSAVPVEGQLVVYGYNDTHAGAASKTPQRKFVFTPDQFTQHFSPTQLGASYSIWIPWDAVGQPQMEISLVPVFTAASGQLLVGQPSHNLLPGPTTAPRESQMTSEFVPLQYGPLNQNGPPPQRNYDVQRVAYEQMAQQAIAQQAMAQQSAPGQTSLTPPQGPLGVETLSITLPGTLADRMAQAPQPQSPMQRLNQYRAAAAGQVGTATSQAAVSPYSITASPAAAAPASPRSVGYQPPAPPAPTAPVPPQAAGPPLSQPFPGALPSAPRATPR